MRRPIEGRGSGGVSQGRGSTKEKRRSREDERGGQGIKRKEELCSPVEEKRCFWPGAPPAETEPEQEPESVQPSGCYLHAR